MTARERAKQDNGALSGRRFHKDEHVQEAKTELNALELGNGGEKKGVSLKGVHNRITTKKPKSGVCGGVEYITCP